MSDSETSETPPENEFTREELKLALKAFHKRLRLTKLDDESQLGRGAMTRGNPPASVPFHLRISSRRRSGRPLSRRGSSSTRDTGSMNRSCFKAERSPAASSGELAL